MAESARIRALVIMLGGSLLLVAALISSCSKKERATQPVIPPTPAPKFVASPDTLFIFEVSPDTAVHVSTDVPGTLDWRVKAKPDWITVTPDSGQATVSGEDVVVSAAAASLGPGTHWGTIEFEAGGEIEMMLVAVSVAEHPRAAASAASLHFAPTEYENAITITNQGTGVLVWSVASTQAWLEVSPASGALLAGRSADIYARVDRRGLAPGMASASMTIASNSEGGPIVIPTSMDPAPLLGSRPLELEFGYLHETRLIKVQNLGNAPLTWTATATEGYLQMTPATGVIGPGGETNVAVTPDRSLLADGTHVAGIDVTSDGLPPRHIPTRVKHFRATKWRLDHPLRDAEFDRVHDRIVAVGGLMSQQLLVLDPEARTVRSLTLPQPAICVSIQPDGLYAATGHDSAISYVDLSSMTVQRTYPVAARASDVVLAGNGWVYAVPDVPGTSMRSIELASGLETAHTGPRLFAARLHPSGESIIAGGFDFYQRFDIRPGTAAFMNGTGNLGPGCCFSLWLSEDGQRVFSRDGLIHDVYTWNRVGRSWLERSWVETSVSANRVLSVERELSTYEAYDIELAAYDGQAFTKLGEVTQSPFLVPNASGGMLVPFRERFVFVNAAGTRVHILLEDPGGKYGWGFASTDMSALP